VPDRPGIDHNVFIVGGGQTGCAFAFALRRAGIGRVSVIDAAENPAKAGVWLNRARMNKLRTPKILVGPEGGLPGLGFRAWYEARFGEASYQEIDRIPRDRWAEYLAWYREFLEIPVRYGTRLLRIEPQDTHLRLHLEVNGSAQVETARKVLLCNGVAGNGGAYVPPVLARLPAQFVAHTSDAIDFAALRGKSVAVLGGAASAFDAAATALERAQPRSTCSRGVRHWRPRPCHARAPIRVRTTTTSICPTRCAGRRRCASNAPARRRRWIRSSASHASRISVCIGARNGNPRVKRWDRLKLSQRANRSTSISRSLARAISSTLPRAPSLPISRRISCCGAISSRRPKATRTTNSARIRISDQHSNIAKRSRGGRLI